MPKPRKAKTLSSRINMSIKLHVAGRKEILFQNVTTLVFITKLCTHPLYTLSLEIASQRVPYGLNRQSRTLC